MGEFKKNDTEINAGIAKEKDLGEVDEKRLQNLEIIAKVVGDDCDMKVGIGSKPGWRYIFKPINKIEVDPNDVIEKGRDYCLGIICHEGSHRKISRVDFIPKKIWQERGFSYLMNAIEDPRVNNWVGEKYDGAKKWLEQVYNEDLSQKKTSEEIAKSKVGYIPKHIQYGSEVIRYWHTGKFSEDLPDEVRNFLVKTINYAELAYNNIPEIIDPSEDDISDAAQKMYKIVYSTIWPEYQKLIDKSYEDEKSRQMIKDMIESGEIELNEEGESSEGEPLPLDQLPEDLKKELEKKIKEKLDSMSEEDKKKFQKKINDKANQVLDDIEEDVNKELKGKFSEQPKTKSEEEKEKLKEESGHKTKEEIGKAEEEIERKLESERTEYTYAHEDVKQYIDKVADDIINLLITKKWPQFKKGFPGQRLRLEGAMKYESKKNYKELFAKRQKMERQKYNFTILVDLSGSMGGDTIKETFRGVVLFTEVLNKIASTLGDVKVSVYGFQDDLLIYKNFDENLDNDMRERMSGMKDEVDNNGLHNQANYNNDGYCLDKVRNQLDVLVDEEIFLFVLSDGQPAGDSTHHIPGYDENSQKEELHAVIKKISQENKIKLLGIGLGPGTEHVGNFYSNELNNVGNVPNVNVKKLSEVLGNKIEELIK